MGDLKNEINASRARYQDQFNGVFALKKEDRDDALTTFLTANIFPIKHKQKWALFPLYVIYELLYQFARTNPVEKVSDAYSIVLLLSSHFIQDGGMQGPAQIDPAMIRSFLANALRNGRGPRDNDELTDFKDRGLCKPFTIGPTSITFEIFLMKVAGPQPQRVVNLHDVADDSHGGKSRRRRQHRRFRSKKRGRKSLRKRRN